ncbi:tryptophan halogenase family protein [Roseateles oligotrophus]|uniref:Tryptophan 7-halogenase n=1 Tax=Roseateles oligotrophus TaxID=1769250 RepID=A0ABT2YKN0_9BURK|nr:tryptophan halogenase family protein [Roseateles oligotrophus]MCV2370616.1 tryptophan 7-halogenase [Roseateles oligotrophus]
MTPHTLTPVRRLVIAGGGTAGWMVAALISKVLGKQLDIRLVESDEIGIVGVGEATIPTLLSYHELMGIQEAEFMAATQATFKLGIHFEGWRNLGEDYFHGFGTTGKDHWTAGFQHFWLKGRERGLAEPYTNYSLEWSAAKAGRFAHLPKNGLNYAYHLDATRYGQYLRGLAEASGVQRIEGKIGEVELAASGDIAALKLGDGTRIEGDLFIDCTGFRSLLLGQALGVGYEDWSHWLPCDSAVAVQTASVGEPLPYTRSIAHPFGWQWRIPLQGRVGNGLVYDSRRLSDDAARSTLLAHIEGETLTTPRTLKFTPGQRHKTWHRNCVAIGLSSGFLEPLESTSIHLIQRSAIRLMQMFPAGGVRECDIEEFNRQSQNEIEHIRDFIILHYHVTNRRDAPLWQHCGSMDVPASLARRIELFRETGRVFHAANELFGENSWIQVMLGQGILPGAHHPTADLMGDVELGNFLGDIRAQVVRTVAQLPTHRAYVGSYCGVAEVAPKTST